jgi:hypothetical protein
MDQLQELYDSELSFQLCASHGQGFTWKLGDEKNGYKAMGTTETLKLAILEMVEAAVVAYPQSAFALMHRRLGN